MAYSTQADLLNHMTEQELIELTDDNNVGQLDPAKVDAAIAVADGMIDAYARGRYALPLVVSEQVKQLSIDIAVWQLEKRRRHIRDATQAAYDAALKFLEKLSSKKVQLDQPGKQQTSAVEVKTPDRTAQEDKFRFGAENLKDF